MPPRKPPPSQEKSKRKPAKKENRHDEQGLSSPIPNELQQLILDVFRNAFATRLEHDIRPLLQEVKGHLYNRDFLRAFGRKDYLEAYAARWSPSRALGYLQLLLQLDDVRNVLQRSGGISGKVVCLGGGAGAEIAAFGGLVSFCNQADASGNNSQNLEVVAVDIADWSEIAAELHRAITTTPPLSKYASAASQAANAPLVDPGVFNVTFEQHDVLKADFSCLAGILRDASLVTIMFTLNELYSASISLTQKFLLNLTACLPENALLLVVDSPGSYSTISLNGTEKKYPMQWLLDHTLLDQGAKSSIPSWTKLNEDESRWFRLDNHLRYPIELENMRMQLHLYRRNS
jgi:25S rRNA (uracil2843-N3)-methyltransferase